MEKEKKCEHKDPEALRIFAHLPLLDMVQIWCEKCEQNFITLIQHEELENWEDL